MTWETVLMNGSVLKNQAVQQGRQMLLDAIVQRYGLDALEQQFVQGQGLAPENLYQGLVDFIKGGSTLEQAIAEEQQAIQIHQEQGTRTGGLTLEQYQKDMQQPQQPQQ